MGVFDRQAVATKADLHVTLLYVQDIILMGESVALGVYNLFAPLRTRHAITKNTYLITLFEFSFFELGSTIHH